MKKETKNSLDNIPPEDKGVLCLNKQESAAEKIERKNWFRRVVAVCLMIVIAFSAVMLIDEHVNRLKGVWALDDTSTYQFDGKGGGWLTMPLSSLHFHYTTENGCLSIDFDEPTATDCVYQYFVRGGLLILDNGESVYELRRQK